MARWLGHSVQVSRKHYKNMVPDELYAQAAEMENSGKKAQRQAQCTVHETAGNEGKAKKRVAQAIGG